MEEWDEEEGKERCNKRNRKEKEQETYCYKVFIGSKPGGKSGLNLYCFGKAEDNLEGLKKAVSSITHFTVSWGGHGYLICDYFRK